MRNTIHHITLAPVPDGAEAFALTRMAKQHRAVIFLARDDVRMERAAAMLRFFAPEAEVLTLPAWDTLPYDRISPNSAVTSRRIQTLSRLAQGDKNGIGLVSPTSPEPASSCWQGGQHGRQTKPQSPEGSKTILLTTINAASQRLIPSEELRLRSLVLKVGEEIDRGSLTEFLVHNGYLNTGTANEPGEFAVRGSILDLVPMGAEDGLRLDFFGDMLESIRAYNLATQMTIAGETRTQLQLTPASEALLEASTVERFRHGYRQHFGAIIKDDPLYEAISASRHYAGMEHWLPLFYGTLETVFDYLPDASLVLDNLADAAFAARLEEVQGNYANRKEAMEDKHADTTYKPVPPELLFLTEQDWNAALASRATCQLQVGDAPNAEATGWQTTPNFSAEAALEKKGAVELYQEFLVSFHSPLAGESRSGKRDSVGGKPSRDIPPTDVRRVNTLAHPAPPQGGSVTMLLACNSEGSRARLEKMLEQQGIKTSPLLTSSEKLPKNTVGLVILPLDNGFLAEGMAIVTEQDILGEKLSRPARKRRNTEHFLEEASMLQEGELVVHREHGIGRFAGLETMEIQGQAHAFLKLLYKDDDRLFVPVENLDLISRYGPADMVVELDKLGGLQWQQRTSKLKQRIRVTAEELLQVAAGRQMNTAPVFHAESAEYEQFCAKFPYTETDDQLNAIEDTLQNLASGKPMDRLVCGDVGFGKTEVALRAAFVVVAGAASDVLLSRLRGRQDSLNEPTANLENPVGVSETTAATGHPPLTPPASGGGITPASQVAIIAPTTLLARQHYESFRRRFAGFPIIIKMLSRLVPAKEQEQVKADLAEGRVDIIIGTHALLSKEIQFKNLTLLIVDEEQHFGVRQKERLKKLRTTTHVLTLTATPIPRTLQLSLAGIRELSLIATPPVDRLAVRTYVMPYDGVILREALMREHYRGGRSFYVCPRVNDLEEVGEKLKKLVPELKVVTAHGQLPPEQLETIMQSFIDGQYDILLSTTIIESGIDIPQANTMIIHRADMFGLAQLYQLRGRVGRSKVRAYAYLTLPPKRIPTETAQKRLAVMQKLDSLGAGFSLASHDMDIRGFGNLLGDEQSGQVKEVGVELYQHLLQEAIQELQRVDKGAGFKVLAAEFSPKVNLGLAVMIPEDYVADLALRLGLYRRIAYLQSHQEVEAMAVELTDRFGRIPPEVENLLTTVKLKLLCQQAGIVKVDAGPKGAVIEFHQNQFSATEKLVALVASRPQHFKLRADQKLAIIGQNWDKLDARLAGMQEMLATIAGLVEKEKLAA